MLIGDLGDRLIEIAASLGILLLVSGINLVWPRAVGWRAVLAFFRISGLAWAGIWGGKFVQAWSSFPAAKWDNVPLSDAKGVWTLSQDSMSYDSPNPTADRTVHIDQYTGKILATVAYADYSLAGKSMAVGISLHEGQMGLWNVVLNIGFCLLMIFVAISGAVMWWKRRPVGAGRLAAPPAANAPLKGGVVLIAIVLSMGFPMLGFTLIAVLALDVLVLQNLPSLKRLLS